MNYNLIFVFLYIIISLSISMLLGDKRRIGTTYSFILCITLSPLIGFFITLNSPLLTNHKAYQLNTESNKNISILLSAVGAVFVLSGLNTLYQYYRLSDEYYRPSYWPAIIFGLGFFVWGKYLYHLPTHIKPVGIINPPMSEPPIKIISKPIKKEKKVRVRKKTSKRTKWIICGVLLFIVITNPSIKMFKDYSGEGQYKYLRRKQNWVLFSVYQNRGAVYIGVVLNFFEIK